MSSEEKALLDRLREKGRKMDDRIEAVNAVLENRETMLREIGLGVEAEIRIQVDDTAPVFFGYGKLDGSGWCLFSREGDADRRPIRDAKRKIRIAAVSEDNWIDLLREVERMTDRFIMGGP